MATRLTARGRRVLVAAVILLLVLLFVITRCAGGSTSAAKPKPIVAPPMAKLKLSNGAVDTAWEKKTAAKLLIPLRGFQAYAAAAHTIAKQNPKCRLGWNMIAAFGRVETVSGTLGGRGLNADGTSSTKILGPRLDGSNGTRALPATKESIALTGDKKWQRAVGPMQFLPSTWAKWAADGDGDGKKNPFDLDDATLAAGKYLCHGRVLTRTADWDAAALSYNNSRAYVRSVTTYAVAYAKGKPR